MSIGVVAHVGQDGSVILPRWIRKVAGIKPGDRLAAFYRDGRLFLVKHGDGDDTQGA